MNAAADILAKPLCALALCWRLDRRDGVTLGLTSHDRAFTAHGLRYEAAPGIMPAAILRSGEADVEPTELAGAISAAVISNADLVAGRWDGATLRVHLTEWTEPGALWLELAYGQIGPVERGAAAYRAAMRGTAALFDKPAGIITSPSCRAQLGDKACRIDLARHERLARVTGIDGNRVMIGGGGNPADCYGTLRWLTGPAAGLHYAIIDSDDAGVQLAETPPMAIAAGALARITSGCDKRLETCVTRFANAVNFQGEPFLPGNDLLTRYPGG